MLILIGFTLFEQYISNKFPDIWSRDDSHGEWSCARSIQEDAKLVVLYLRDKQYSDCFKANELILYGMEKMELHHFC